MIGLFLVTACAMNVADSGVEVEGPLVVNRWLGAQEGDSILNQFMFDQNGATCISIRDDGNAWMISEERGLEGPWDWCAISEDAVTANGITVRFEELNEKEFWVTVTHDTLMIHEQGTLGPCEFDTSGWPGPMMTLDEANVYCQT